jgi:hypothetical protein
VRQSSTPTGMRRGEEPAPDWHAIMRGLIRGVRRELGRNASATTRAGLTAFEKRLALSSTNRSRKKFEREFERYLLGKADLRRAAERNERRQVERAVKKLARSSLKWLRMAERLVEQRHGQKALQEFRRKTSAKRAAVLRSLGQLKTGIRRRRRGRRG